MNAKNIFKIVSFLIVVYFCLLILILAISFYNLPFEHWVEKNTSLFPLLGLLLASILAASAVMKTIENTNNIENNRKLEELYTQRLYFGSTMRGIVDTCDYYVNKLQTHLDHAGDSVTLEGDIKYFFEELDDIFKDYIKILNDNKLPKTLKEIKKDFIKVIQDLVELKNKMYHLKPRLKSLSLQQSIDKQLFKFIIISIQEISDFALNIKEKNVK